MTTFTAQFTHKLFMAGVVLFLFLAPLKANTVTPNTVGYEGFLAQANGAPVATGAYTLTFRVYGIASGGAALWTEQQTGIQVTNGLYAVVLGGATPFTPDTFNGNRWIGVTVGNGTEIAPRTQISSVPFSLNADSANKISGGGTANMVALFDGPCPDGWAEYTAAQGRYVVGVPANGTLGVMVGLALSDQENRPVGQHTHTLTDPGHTHVMWHYDLRGGGNTIVYPASEQTLYTGHYVGQYQTYNTQNSETDITINNSGSISGTNAPYIQLRYCKLNS